MRVIATAGHVDHGKSTLVRALTGTDPDRLEEEKRRGLTIDLGFAGLDLPSSEKVAFVDVPGHRRFIGNMLAGLGPAPAVMLVVAADQGWQAQSREHLDAIDALGLRHGMLVLTRCALASPERVEAVRETALGHVASTSLGQVPVVETDAVTGAGIDELRSALDELVASMPPVDLEAPVRLWVDRSFTIKGTGTVVTGTLAAGELHVGDQLEVGDDRATVRSLQVLGDAMTAVGPVSRVAVALRGVSRDDVPRGTPLLTPGTGCAATIVDVRREGGLTWPEASEEVSVHIGTAAVPARVRPLDDDHARLTLEEAVPLLLGDRLIVRDDSASRIHCGATVLDLDPKAFSRRGAATQRGELLATWSPARASDIVDDRGCVPVAWLDRAGAHGHDGWGASFEALMADGAEACAVVRGHAVSASHVRGWLDALRDLVARDATNALSRGVPVGVVADTLGTPVDLVAPLVALAHLRVEQGRVVGDDHATHLGGADAAVEMLRQRLQRDPFDAPESDDLVALGLGTRQIAAAATRGLLLRLPADPIDILLLPDAPARAMRVLAGLAQPFTTSEARQALGTTRRVVIPLLEHLDGRGWTRRDGNARSVVR